MLDAFWFGLISAGSLAIGAVLAVALKLPKKVLGLIMAFGVGALISSVAFELIEDSFNYSNDLLVVLLGVGCGSLVYFICDYLVDKFGGANRKSPEKNQSKSGLAILAGTVLDGIPESMVIGLSLAQGGAVSVAMMVAVFISNIPEALSSSVGLLKGGWKKRSIFGLWTVVILISALASLAGYAIFGDASAGMRAFVMAFAGGAILTMLADSMMPEAYKYSGRWAGIVTVLGFCVAFAVSMFE